MENKIIAVRFKKTGKIYYFDPLDFKFNINDNVIAQTERGEEVGRVVKILKKSDINANMQINKISRPAKKKDLENFKKRDEMAREVVVFCKEEVKKLKLKMKILTAEYILDGTKLTIYFSADERIDFRDLVKNLACKFKTRIELRQIGPRDEIKVYPNLGMCGKEVCCRTFLHDFEPVTIKMAKEQGLQINMSKLSGACGKLMCCLRYEEKAYKESLKHLPKLGTFVKVEGESTEGKVISIDVLSQKLKLKFQDNDSDRFEIYPADMIISNKKKS